MKHKIKSKYKCKLCGTDCEYAYGIGDFCPNSRCENLDGMIGKEPNDLFELKEKPDVKTK